MAMHMGTEGDKLVFSAEKKENFAKVLCLSQSQLSSFFSFENL